MSPAMKVKLSFSFGNKLANVGFKKDKINDISVKYLDKCYH